MEKGIGTVTVGIKMQEPNWQLLCMGLAAANAEALANLENGNAKRALELLTAAKGNVQMAFMCEANTPGKKDYCDKRFDAI